MYKIAIFYNLAFQEKAEDLSESKFVAETMQRELHAGWPEGYFEKVIGPWQGDFEEPEDLPLEVRNPLF